MSYDNMHFLAQVTYVQVEVEDLIGNCRENNCVSTIPPCTTLPQTALPCASLFQAYIIEDNSFAPS